MSVAPAITIAVAPVRKSILVEASQAHCFEIFTAGIGRWWPNCHHIGAAEVDRVVMEAKRGGRWYERGVDGTECDWGKVLAWEPPGRLVLSWKLNSRFERDEAVDSEVELRFIAEAAGSTRVELEHRIAAADGEALRAGVDSEQGWGYVLGLFGEAAASSS